MLIHGAGLGYEGVDGCNVVHDRDQWQTLVNTVMNLEFLEFLYQLTDSMPRRTLLHSVRFSRHHTTLLSDIIKHCSCLTRTCQGCRYYWSLLLTYLLTYLLTHSLTHSLTLQFL
jgi:hypothetical protein